VGRLIIALFKNLEKIKKLVEEIQISMEDFCRQECHAFCCRKGYLMLSRKEVELVVGDKENILIAEGRLKEMINGKYSLSFENSLGGCPQLKDNKCMIHSEVGRSNTCKDFPILILRNKIKISNRCPAKKENKFFKFEKEAIALGYEVVEEFF